MSRNPPVPAAPTLSQPPAHESLQLEEAMQALTAVSNDLLASYGSLEKRAQRVERELGQANERLEEKVAQLDAVTRDLEAILESLPVGVVVRDAHEHIVRANTAAYEIFGCPPQASERRDADALREHPGLAGPGATGEPREIACPDGKTRFIASRYCSIRNAREEMTGSVEILDDCTEVTALNERLHQLDKLAALGNMAGGIAHEVRNPMNAVKGFAALLRRRLAPESKEAAWANLIVRGVDEANEILSSMLTLAHPERLTLEHIDARELVEAAVQLAISSAGVEPSALEITTSVAVESLVADRVKLRQVLRNLISNALQVQGTGARVHVAVSREGEEVLFSVRDAGPGIPAELRRRIFDPFFTTRAEGTGLGLALVSTIARLHGGRVELAASKPPKPGSLAGAEINLFLPQV